MNDFNLDAESEGHVTTLTFVRGTRNYFTAELLHALADRLEQLADSHDTRCVVLRGGRHFCAGAQLISSDSADQGRLNAEDLYREALRIFAQPLPIVAAISGAAIGGGLGLALAADLRVASPEAQFGAPFARLGFHHGFGLSETLPMAVGQQKALELLYSGRVVRGNEAFRMGLCDRLASEDQLVSEASSIAHEIALSAPIAVRSIRQTMRASLVQKVTKAVQREITEQAKQLESFDAREGILAANEHRRPRFIGK